MGGAWRTLRMSRQAMQPRPAGAPLRLLQIQCPREGDEKLWTLKQSWSPCWRACWLRRCADRRCAHQHPSPDRHGQLEHPTCEVLTASEDLLRSIVNIETALRGSVVSGKEKLLELVNQGAKDFCVHLDRARSLTADNPAPRSPCALTSKADQLTFRHSSRGEALNVSTRLLSVGLGGLLKSHVHISINRPVNSLPWMSACAFSKRRGASLLPAWLEETSKSAVGLYSIRFPGSLRLLSLRGCIRVHSGKMPKRSI
ncbi:CHASE3 domain-containing protein [Pelomonas cellulosilytica]|uniref:CHASE3 domain-containing protein n=1 Tax=Pelomonas cellulosilytica TaxID=2906762 RepID=UPI003B0182D0